MGAVGVSNCPQSSGLMPIDCPVHGFGRPIRPDATIQRTIGPREGSVNLFIGGGWLKTRIDLAEPPDEMAACWGLWPARNGFWAKASASELDQGGDSVEAPPLCLAGLFVAARLLRCLWLRHAMPQAPAV